VGRLTVVLALTLGLLAATAGSRSPWRLEPTPNAVAWQRGVLNADSCASATACTAVGSYENTAGNVSTLALARTDGSWRRQATPNPPDTIRSVLAAVSCPSATACTAVGRFFRAVGPAFKGSVGPLAEGWSGGRWRLEVTPSPAGSRGARLNAISCPSALSCTAVGYFTDHAGADTVLAESWTGQSWHVVAVPRPAGVSSSWLYGVSCRSVTACTAVGADKSRTGTHPLAERWNGSSWQAQAVAGIASGSLAAVSCSSARSCVAVGPYGGRTGTVSLAAAWNGRAWHAQFVPGPAGSQGSQLLAVSCHSPAACTAVGGYGPSLGQTAPLTERWNGTSWQLQTTPDPGGSIEAQLSGVSCPSAVTCTSAGNYEVPYQQTLTLALSWSAQTWRVQPTPTPKGAAASVFNALACSAPADCTAVGWFSASNGNSLTLAERWNGTSWRLQSTPNPPDNLGLDLTGVSCGGPASCVAVGSYTNSTGAIVALTEIGNGTTWRIESVPSLPGATQTSLSAVSCTGASACTAVGVSIGQHVTPVAATWNGTSWQVQSLPVPANASGGALYGVSCPAASACTAVGEYYTSAPDPGALTESGHGTSWSLPATPNPVTDGSLRAVSCTAASACTAVGNYGSFGSQGDRSPTALAEVWDGSSWQTQPVPNPKGNPPTELTGVSCSSTLACSAVGTDTITGIAEAWSGHRWSLQTPASPAHTDGTNLSSVWCVSAGDCTAVGDYFNFFVSPLTLAITTAGSHPA
jgi:hypothetical protein